MAIKPHIKITETDHGWQNISQTRRKVKDYIGIDGGLLKDHSPTDTPFQEIVLRGWKNEFGWEPMVPKRPWLRQTFDRNKRKYAEKMIDIAWAIYSRDANIIKITRQIKRLGDLLEMDLFERVSRFSNPPNAEFTIEKKGFDDPLVETGDMLQTISHRITDRK